MARRNLSRRRDRRVFKKTANRVPVSSLAQPAMRGGFMR